MTDELSASLQEFKTRLAARQKELETLNAVSRESREAVSLDQSKVGRLSRMDAMQAQQMAAETGRRRKIEIQRIKSALERIDNDEFGYCIICEEEIGYKRLNNDPSVPTCIHCARR